MLIDDFIINVFCLVDDEYNFIVKNKLRLSGPGPKLKDSEVMTMEIVGEFFGIDTDTGIHSYFKNHWKEFFPEIGDRSAFTRQAAGLINCKKRIQINIANKLGALNDNIHLIDGFPMPVCNFKVANFSKNFKGDAAYGYCASKNQTYFGFKGHLLVNFNGVVTDFTLTAANVDEREAALNFVDKITGLLIGDKGYISENVKKEMRDNGIDLQTPLRDNMQDNRPKAIVSMLMDTRRLIETVIGQLTERFNIQKVRAKNCWHLLSRLNRKLLAHTVCVFINKSVGNGYLDFDNLIKI